MNISIDAIKQAVGETAVHFIREGMTVGLGSGSTASHFIKSLVKSYKEGLNIQVVASSDESLRMAREGGIPIKDINSLTFVDITVDGADEIDPFKRMIKGRGGALVREKILASISKEMVIIIDETKLSSQLGKHPLPVEIIPFSFTAIQHKLEQLGYVGKWRKDAEGNFFITENKNYIFDVYFDKVRSDPEKDHEILMHIPGVVDTGFFFGLAGRVIVGYFNGQIKILP